MSSNERQNNKEAAEHYDVFLSYSRKDTQTAMLLKFAIQSLGYTVFYDQDILEGDSNWRATIAKNIDNCSGLVFFRTSNSVASKWCQREVNIADESGKIILPVAYRRDQTALPVSDDLKAALSSLQTTLISDSPSIPDLKNELQAALKNSIETPSAKGNSLLLTEFILSAAKNISLRYHSLFEYIGADDISADIDDWQIALRWRLKLGDERANIVIALNKYSKRPQCYGNCPKDKKSNCPFYAEKDRKEYSMEACLEFVDKSRKSMICAVLDTLLCSSFKDQTGRNWCGNEQSIKYFFRKRVLPDKEVNEVNDFNAVLLLLNEAVSFYDTIFEKLEKYVKYACDICEIFRKKEFLLTHLNSQGNVWEHNDELKSNAKIHFYKNVPPSDREELNSQLGVLSSVAVKYPEALRIRLLAFEETRIRIWLIRFEKDKEVGRIHDFDLSELSADDKERKAKIAEQVKEEIDFISAQEAKYRVSTLPGSIHEYLRDFIKENSSLNWEVIQNGPSIISAAGIFRSKEKNSDTIKDFSQLRFTLQIKYHAAQKTVDLSRHITSDFPGADENKLSEITGFSVSDEFARELDHLKDFFAEVSKQLNSVHNNVYRIYKKLANLETRLCTWKKNKAATVLFVDNTQSGYLNAYKDNETCWEFFLSPGTRMCRRLGKQEGKEYPVMFCIRFGASGAGNAVIGWYGDHSFNNLTPREKELFWRYVISQFPQELKDKFVYQNNAIFLSETPEEEMKKRRAKIFPTVDDVEKILTVWLEKRDGGSLIEQMFSPIEKAVEEFNIQKHF